MQILYTIQSEFMWEIDVLVEVDDFDFDDRKPNIVDIKHSNGNSFMTSSSDVSGALAQELAAHELARDPDFVNTVEWAWRNMRDGVKEFYTGCCAA